MFEGYILIIVGTRTGKLLLLTDSLSQLFKTLSEAAQIVTVSNPPLKFAAKLNQSAFDAAALLCSSHLKV
jgi:hypothetical protein